jgi:hypothetical protein
VLGHRIVKQPAQLVVDLRAVLKKAKSLKPVFKPEAALFVRQAFSLQNRPALLFLSSP